MTLGIVVHSGDMANLGDKAAQVAPFSPDIYVEELGYNQNPAEPLFIGSVGIFEGLYRMQPKDPDKQIERALEAAEKAGYKKLVLRMIEFPLKDQGDYAMKAAEAIKGHGNIKILSSLNYMMVKDSITYRTIAAIPHTIDVMPLIRLTNDEGMISQVAGALANIAKGNGNLMEPCLQLVGAEEMDEEQVKTFCTRILGSSDSLYLWSLGTVAGNPIAEQIMKYMKTTYPEVGKGDIDEDRPTIVPSPQVVAVEPGNKMGTVAISDLSIRKDCSLSAKIVGSLQMSDRVEYTELVWATTDLSFVHLKNGYWAVQHWSGVDYIIVDDTDNIKSSGGAI